MSPLRVCCSGQRAAVSLARLADVWFDCQAVRLLEVSMRIRTTVVALVMSSLMCSPLALAQQRHVVAPAALRQAVADLALTDQQNRDVLLSVLHNAQVRALADRLGLSLTGAEGAVSTLGSAELASLAGQARAADVQLAGGERKIVIGTTTLLLLIIILILVT
jgi:hypothetical protein